MSLEKKISILLVEDDTNLGFVVKDNLDINGYKVTLCEDGETAWNNYEKGKVDLCILDIMLPKMDGFTLAEKIRAVDDQVPILFLSAKSMKEDKIQGFKIGADDYITKPFSIEELLLRIEVFLRRSSRHDLDVETSFKIGQYHLTIRIYASSWEVKKKASLKEKLIYSNIFVYTKKQS